MSVSEGGPATRLFSLRDCLSAGMQETPLLFNALLFWIFESFEKDKSVHTG